MAAAASPAAAGEDAAQHRTQHRKAHQHARIHPRKPASKSNSSSSKASSTADVHATSAAAGSKRLEEDGAAAEQAPAPAPAQEHERLQQHAQPHALQRRHGKHSVVVTTALVSDACKSVTGNYLHTLTLANKHVRAVPRGGVCVWGEGW